jgi:hypothetical protein
MRIAAAFVFSSQNSSRKDSESGVFVINSQSKLSRFPCWISVKNVGYKFHWSLLACKTTTMRSNELLDWPDYHARPLALSNVEIADPFGALQKFFNRYDLPILRFRLKQWLDDALLHEDTQAGTVVDLYHELIRLAEAASELHEQHQIAILRRFDQLQDAGQYEQEQQALRDAFAPPQPPATGRGHNDTSTTDGTGDDNEAGPHGNIFYCKAPRSEEFAYISPEGALRDIFGSWPFSDMQQELERWKRIAMRSECTVYDQADQREQLLDWLDHLPALLEALDRIQQFGSFAGVTITLPTPARMLRDYPPGGLSEAQAKDPLSVVTTYFQRFSLKGSHRELWSLFEAVVMDRHDGYTSIRRFAPTAYRCYFAALDAAYRLSVSFIPSETIDSDLEKSGNKAG